MAVSSNYVELMSSLPGNERLEPGYVRPSRQLLDFYRKKIAQYENEHDIIVKKLNEYSKSHEVQHQLDWEIRQRDEEISELQKALSDMQIFLFKEREQVLNLYTENDAFKVRDLENKRTVQQLLALRGGAVDGEVSYFFKEPPEQPIIPNKTKYKEMQSLKLQGKHPKKGRVTKAPFPNRLKELEKPDQVTLSLQIEALQSQIADQERWAREFVEAMSEDKNIKVEEHDTRSKRDLEKVKVITEKLHKTQDLLYESTQDMLKLRQQWTENEKKWESEKDALILELDTSRGRVNVNRMDYPEISVVQQHNASNNILAIDSTTKYRLEGKKLRTELEDTTKMSEMYREQVISLEDEIAAYKEKEHLKSDVYEDKMGNMSKRYQIMKTRYEDLEKRRNLEVEGFKNDIKSLRKELKVMERQLYKTTLQFGGAAAAAESAVPDLDLAVLRQVRKTASRSLKLNNQLKGIKDKAYELEEDMRHL